MTGKQIKKPVVECLCKDVEVGSFDNQVVMVLPFDMGNRKAGDKICADVCLATLLGFLWKQGVETLSNCCGHNKLKPSIVVAKSSEIKMTELGYEYSVNNCGVKEYLV